jgi:hypothetical protein
MIPDFTNKTLEDYLFQEKNIPILEEVISSFSKREEELDKVDTKDSIDISEFSEKDYLLLYQDLIFPKMCELFPNEKLVQPRLNLYEGKIVDSSGRISEDFKNMAGRNYVSTSIFSSALFGSFLLLSGFVAPEVGILGSLTLGAIGCGAGSLIGGAVSVPYSTLKYVVKNKINSGGMIVNNPYDIDVKLRNTGDIINTMSHELAHSVSLQIMSDKSKYGLNFLEGFAENYALKTIDAFEEPLFSNIKKKTYYRGRDLLTIGYHSVCDEFEIPINKQKFVDKRMKDNYLSRALLEEIEPYSHGFSSVLLLEKEFGNVANWDL